MISEDLKQALRQSVWDYDVTDADLADIFEGRKRTFSLNREKLCARLLVSVHWYRLLDLLGRPGVMALLEDEVLRQIRHRDVRDRFVYARRLLGGS